MGFRPALPGSRKSHLPGQLLKLGERSKEWHGPDYILWCSGTQLIPSTWQTYSLSQPRSPLEGPGALSPFSTLGRLLLTG